MDADRVLRPGDEFVLGSPNRMVWQHFDALRRLADRSRAEPEEDHQKQDAMIAIGWAVAAFETFLNVFFRVVVTESPYHSHAGRILRDLERRASLEHKLTRWPLRVFGHGLDFAAPTGKAFLELKRRRDILLDFVSTHQTVQVDVSTRIDGLADIAAFETLNPDDASAAVDVAEGMVAEVLRLRGVEGGRLQDNLRLWTGKAPR